MKFLKGKLFQEVSSGKVVSVRYQDSDNYYDLIRDAQQKGLRQIIITSNIMLSLCEHFLLDKDIEVVSIDFLIEDHELTESVDAMIRSLSSNRAYWAILRRHLEFLQKEDSIDIKTILFREKIDGELFSVYVNGIFEATDQYYAKISEVLAAYVVRCLD